MLNFSGLKMLLFLSLSLKWFSSIVTARTSINDVGTWRQRGTQPVTSDGNAPGCACVTGWRRRPEVTTYLPARLLRAPSSGVCLCTATTDPRWARKWEPAWIKTPSAARASASSSSWNLFRFLFQFRCNSDRKLGGVTPSCLFGRWRQTFTWNTHNTDTHLAEKESVYKQRTSSKPHTILTSMWE